MGNIGFEALNKRIDKAQTILAEDLFNQQPLIFDDRVPNVDTDDNDILANFKGNVFAADLINDGQRALVYEAGQMTAVKNSIINLKIGSALEQGLLDQLARMNMGAILPDDEGLLGSRINALADNLVRGIRLRRNALKYAMVTGQLNYSRFGIKITNGSWGEPAGIRTIIGTAWSNPASTPIANILTQAQYDLDNFGEVRNRVTMPMSQLNNIVKTDEFANRFRGLFRFDFPAGSIDIYNAEQNRQTLGRMLNMTVETHDTSFRVREANGTISTVRVQPSNEVVLWNTADDGAAATWDFANTVVTESLVAGIPGIAGAPVGLAGRKRGPVSYFTLQDPRLNPPGVVSWAVQRGWVRKHRETAASVLVVG